MADGALAGTYAVGVDSTGTIALVVGLDRAPSPLWGEMLLNLDGRPDEIIHVRVNAPGGSTTDAPTQVELRLATPDLIAEALSWLRNAIVAVNATYENHSRHLADIYRAALDETSQWFGDTTSRPLPPNGHLGNPRLN
jgi:hypothetical protein